MTHQLLSSTQSRPSIGHADLPAIAAFYEICEQVDQLNNTPTLADLQRHLDHPPPGGTHHRQLWETPEGALVGLVALWIDDPTDVPTDALEGWVGVFVHPDWRGAYLETELLSWAEQQVREQATVAQRPAQLYAGARADATYYRAIYETANYEMIRRFHTMARSLAEPIPQPQLPSGFTNRPTHADEAAAWVELFNESFVDHWHFTPMTLEDRQFRLTYPTYRPELDWVAATTDGTLTGFCRGDINHEENVLKNRQEGWISLLGTRRGYRRQGLARAMLLQGLHQLRAAGIETALLGVDIQNPNQAMGLYESVGFAIKETHLTYQKSLAETPDSRP
ncbi:MULTISPECIES: GNAT family N-acetyltransferase [Cyanophyceae]|uniref:GNAT family N-acetyltransferase n=1 Tax=Cyanophyceae TaxID=3028117 RepID=UPI001684154C|nr:MULTISPECIES: GNAT family N-acetyltransferase [Cyanophyceae]MBD1916115.1 GNAT family N-acetyltransferase [Phormidium sp. FACHB-77]MBD2031616.1 GNAT family N-acetyltransferase [Phormidium sp. FACHB-322]MBD2052757.1 GNAT family N-acetyltransferase [Leptolyngbya sp. FACHB-60]